MLLVLYLKIHCFAQGHLVFLLCLITLYIIFRFMVPLSVNFLSRLFFSCKHLNIPVLFFSIKTNFICWIAFDSLSKLGDDIWVGQFLNSLLCCIDPYDCSFASSTRLLHLHSKSGNWIMWVFKAWCPLVFCWLFQVFFSFSINFSISLSISIYKISSWDFEYNCFKSFQNGEMYILKLLSLLSIKMQYFSISLVVFWVLKIKFVIFQK